MRIVIVGPGAMGCLVASFLSGKINDLWLLDNDYSRTKTISDRGIIIDSDSKSETFKINITTEINAIKQADIIFICVKAYDTAKATRSCLPIIQPETIIVTLQNGAGNAEKIAEIIDASQIVCGSTSYGSTYIDTGHVKHSGTGPTFLADYTETKNKNSARVAKLLTESGIKTEVIDNAETLVWNKLIINAGINPLTAIHNIRNGQILEDPEIRSTMHKAVSEAASIANAKEISLSYDNPIEETEKICKKTAQNCSSMLQDIRIGRRTEIDAITGTIISEASALNIPVPVNEILLKKVTLLEYKH